MALTSTSLRGGAPASVIVPLVAVLGLLLLSTVTLPVLVGAGVFSGEEDTPASAYGDAGDIPAELVGAILSVGRTCATVSPGLLAAQLEQESGFDPRARSPVGAQGIAQFLPGTWSAYGSDGDGDGRADPDNPADAIPAAARYDCAVAAAVAHLPGDSRRVMLAAYNAGPGAVLTHGGVPPYQETQTYVERILAREPAMTAALTAAGSPAGQATPAARAAIAFARNQLGDPYAWGANGPDAWDCSSLVQAAYAAAGIRLPRVTYDQADQSGPTIPLEDVDAWQPGDLLFAAGSDGTPDNPGHVGIYLGNRQVLHAPRTGDVVKIVPLDAYPTVTGVTRPATLAEP
ncbi:bifunctional lytic transglycosylase/C40 family peptidase [Frankia sp. CNm7]|uniref:Bifunctional lytic transglycosylase/C40 family peptidase n=1 Tax=Frankia nepalensis TaxID=1836974 RepID=A0A937USY9_9ACTN|nr:bifunctional lytic transglycosylase/C40 family peptidase [Frankia nepalensis]MBL7499544.1 bifunctional lytic transglycosylase/C40 family peptidase [Frankia nepalensis]MBL7515623.1 bifunctional lytic transglycosylase/C40 family peptidase [Frankia nepalensis]MBL7524636.1 bifunctional lytic transglycosylase/C40 family peptidase [Frankia nepalensis]MBL7630720.1 bifunctional lytic transglycosylase/C40 family peptidase [Frankia nepalensis]